MIFTSRLIYKASVALATGSGVLVSHMAGAAGESAGLPQLDISTWPNQLLWLAITFTAGYILMAKIITPRIGAVLDMRRQTIADDLKRAKDADADARQMKQAYEDALEDARMTATEAARKAMDEARAQADAGDAVLSAKLAKKTKAAEAKLAKMRDEALASIDDVAGDLTLDTVLSVTGMKITQADAGKALKRIAGLSAREA